METQVRVVVEEATRGLDGQVGDVVVSSVVHLEGPRGVCERRRGRGVKVRRNLASVGKSGSSGSWVSLHLVVLKVAYVFGAAGPRFCPVAVRLSEGDEEGRSQRSRREGRGRMVEKTQVRGVVEEATRGVDGQVGDAVVSSVVHLGGPRGVFERRRGWGIKVQRNLARVGKSGSSRSWVCLHLAVLPVANVFGAVGPRVCPLAVFLSRRR